MRVSFGWLCELAGVHDVPLERAAEVLTMAGWNVEEVTRIDLSEIRIGRVLSQEPHPSSRNPLWVYQVDVGDQTRQIIAGVDNASPGSLVPVALPAGLKQNIPGTYLFVVERISRGQPVEVLARRLIEVERT